MASIPGVRIEGTRLVAAVEPPQLNAVTAALSTMDLATLTITPASLEEVFLRHYEVDADEPNRVGDEA